MKLKLVFITAFLAISTSVVHAGDTPDILSSLSENSIQYLSKSDASKARGEYAVYKRAARGEYIRIGYIVSSNRSQRYCFGRYSCVYLGSARANGQTYYVSK